MRTQLTCFAIAALFTTTLFAQTPESAELAVKEATDGSWIGVSGTVESTSTGTFMLDYGEGSIKVSVDPEGTNPHEFIANEAVTVYGILDEGFFKASTINARTVYLDSQKSYACTSDGADAKVATFMPALYTGTVVYGRVTKVTNDGFVVNDAGTTVTVDTSALPGATQEATGEPTVHVGDRVAVVGDITKGFFTGRTLAATSLNVVH